MSSLFFSMYELVRGIIDNVLMGPALAPVTTFVLVLFLVFSAVGVLTGNSPDDLEVD